ncbi:MAG: MFS transporter [Acidimicrobiia bacterium]|nr:MFS transporter [Acidimicrobiia bacterium]MYG58732.1 MFS transporter [Acidimicrobiia bacterium]MYJ33456.1 MFS transporter [Acidimicrobiia bacterium]
MSRLEFDRADIRALRAVAVQFFVNGALFASFVPRLPEIRDRVEISVAGVGALLSIAGVFGLAGSAVVGHAISRFGTRAVMVGAGGLLAMSLAVVGLATTPALLLVGLAAMMVFDVMVDVAMNMQGSWLSARRHAPVMNRLHGLWSLGALVGGAVSSRVAAAEVSLTAHLLVAAMVLLALLGFVGPGLLRVDETPEPTPEVGKKTAIAQRSLKTLALFVVVGFSAAAMESTSFDWAAFRLTDDLGASAGFAALGYVAVMGGMTAARFAGDWASVRLGNSRLVTLSAFMAGTGLAVASLVPNRYVIVAGYVAAGLGIAALLPSVYDAAAKRPGRPGAGLGALTGGLRTAILVIPFVIGSIAGTGLDIGGAVAIVALPATVIFLSTSARVRVAAQN